MADDAGATSNTLTDVPGFRVGHAQRVGGGALTGVTVVLAPAGGAVAGVDVRGGGPGTRETDALDPRNLVPRVDAVVLTGGSAFGLDAAGGVVAWLEEQGRGFRVGPEPSQVVPVVPTAALFDLGRGGDWHARPDAALGRAAAEAAGAAGHAPVALGNVGAGTGAVAGGLKGGIGSASVRLPSGVTVGALVAVNAVGSAVDPVTGELYAARFGQPGEFPELHAEPAAAPAEGPSLNTTLAVVATDTTLTKAQAHKLAGTSHDGLARALRPVHLLSDGDTVFALASGARPLPVPEGDPAFAVHVEAAALNELYAAAADAVTRAVGRAMLAAETVGEFHSFRDKCANRPNCG
ncbi:P1 family peptidase [Streptacidiphilus jiangxiensis]|uniref:Putative pantetheine hydrolase n=3 Tax=Streptacidiphilus jiangxiensis TaxID=235985 RepID=A0A1H7JR67_STRJI|nr:P1 family peptidase [Streptacidiphilus jiangxiensis]SEK76806.1 putative pantetheine hydrolase [Streptacidiphilus jiangxiensis]